MKNLGCVFYKHGENKIIIQEILKFNKLIKIGGAYKFTFKIWIESGFDI